MALDFDNEKSKDNLLPCKKKFLLPDGQEITLRQEHFLCPEALFQPSLLGESGEGSQDGKEGLGPAGGPV